MLYIFNNTISLLVTSIYECNCIYRVLYIDCFFCFLAFNYLFYLVNYFCAFCIAFGSDVSDNVLHKD